MTARNRNALTILGILLVLAAGRFYWGSRSQPQLPASDEVFKTVDALFTAITARDESRLTACEQVLARQHRTAELPGPPWRRLQRVIATARSGDWESAAHRLYDFIQGQRRENSAASGRSPLAAVH